jgi:hypothetical protein
MTIATRVLGVRYAYRTELHEDGPGTDGVVVLQEKDGTRHGAILFDGAIGPELLEALFNDPGEPTMAHELFVCLLKSAGTDIVTLKLEHMGDGSDRPGSITTRQGGHVTTQSCGAYDLVGFSLATSLPIEVEEELFAIMHEAAPPLDEMMGTKKLSAADMAQQQALLDDGTTIGRA